jgi:hypothetical protein
MLPAVVMKALANERRVEILNWLRDPTAHFPPQRDGDLVKDASAACTSPKSSASPRRRRANTSAS